MELLDINLYEFLVHYYFTHLTTYLNIMGTTNLLSYIVLENEQFSSFFKWTGDSYLETTVGRCTICSFAEHSARRYQTVEYCFCAWWLCGNACQWHQCGVWRKNATTKFRVQSFNSDSNSTGRLWSSSELEGLIYSDGRKSRNSRVSTPRINFTAYIWHVSWYLERWMYSVWRLDWIYFVWRCPKR